MEEVMWVRKIEYPEDLAKAIKACPNNAFVIAMQEFYVETGYLTPKQLMALSCVRPKRRRKKTYPWWREDYSDYPGDFGMEWWK